METFIPIIVGVIVSVIFYGLSLLISRDRMISIMISALSPVIVLVMSLVLVDFSLVDLNVVFSGTVIGIIVNGLISFVLKNKIA
ncbi:MAG TPA: hypothetical protein VK094_08245 [Pseudogracilibacillus sp.]|nr:hypothetical protein [Pseudogracilibacillus sp.]